MMCVDVMGVCGCVWCVVVRRSARRRRGERGDERGMNVMYNGELVLLCVCVYVFECE